MTEWDVPVIDIGPYESGLAADKLRVAAEVGWACENIGFLVLDNHGIPRKRFDRAFDVSRQFFDLPVEEKLRFRPEHAATPRGYSEFARLGLAQTLGQETPPDLREQFYIGPLEVEPKRFAHIPGAARFYTPNIWPDRPEAYRPVYSELYRTLEVLAARLMRIFALALELDEHYFDDKIDHHFSTLPCNHYPAPAPAPLPGQLRTGAHTDFGSLTMLAMDDAPGGLQVMMPDGAWRDVRPAPEHLVVNLGDMMARWTNDRWKSTLHRAVNPPTELTSQSRRQTLGYFLHPNYDAEVTCLAGCSGADHPPKYAPIMAGEHMRQKMEVRVA